jgi:uncharacterized protein
VPATPANTITPRREIKNYQVKALINLRYVALPLGTTDATVVAIAERLGATEVATLDRRHFTVVRPAHANAFTLLP